MFSINSIIKKGSSNTLILELPKGRIEVVIMYIQEINNTCEVSWLLLLLINNLRKERFIIIA